MHVHSPLVDGSQRNRWRWHMHGRLLDTAVNIWKKKVKYVDLHLISAIIIPNHKSTREGSFLRSSKSIGWNKLVGKMYFRNKMCWFEVTIYVKCNTFSIGSENSTTNQIPMVLVQEKDTLKKKDTFLGTKTGERLRQHFTWTTNTKHELRIVFWTHPIQFCSRLQIFLKLLMSCIKNTKTDEESFSRLWIQILVQLTWQFSLYLYSRKEGNKTRNYTRESVYLILSHWFISSFPHWSVASCVYHLIRNHLSPECAANKPIRLINQSIHDDRVRDGK